MAPLVMQKPFQFAGDGGFAGAGQSGEPDDFRALPEKSDPIRLYNGRGGNGRRRAVQTG